MTQRRHRERWQATLALLRGVAACVQMNTILDHSPGRAVRESVFARRADRLLRRVQRAVAREENRLTVAALDRDLTHKQRRVKRPRQPRS